MEAVLADCVRESLSKYLYSNAAFLCERLYASYSSEANLYLLATCYFRANSAHRAYTVLEGAESPLCRYLFALSCHSLGRLNEAEAALSPSLGEVPNGAAGHYLLGLICKQTDRRQAAITHFSTALSRDPFLWSAYEELCALGAEAEATSLYGDAALGVLDRLPYGKRANAGQSGEEGQEGKARDTGGTSTTQSPPLSTTNGAPAEARARPTSAMPAGPGLGFGTPAPSPEATTPSTYTTPQPGALGLGRAGQGTVSGGETRPPRVSRGDEEDSRRGAPGAPGRRKFVDEGKLRKVSGRLFAEPPLASVRRSSRLSASAAPTDADTPKPSTAAHTASRRNSHTETPTQTPCSAEADTPASSGSKGPRASQEMACKMLAARKAEGEAVVVGAEAEAEEGLRAAFALLRVLGRGLLHLSLFRAEEAARTFLELPAPQYATGWVLCQVGRAHFERVAYAEAERAFCWARQVCPHRLEHLDVFSTVLWHLKKDTNLSHLAQEALLRDRLAPQAWCVLGNCFSLAREPEVALRFFQRALQLDPAFVYAHTLCGHEYVAMEDLEEGLAAYRTAVRLDPRHYNAWYGLGTVYFRQEKFELAEYHFRRALAINQRSSVLHCYLGMALHALKRNAEALELLQQAIAMDAKNPLPKFERASVLMSAERYNDALTELDALKEVAPREASVYFLVGKIYKKLDMPDRAMLHYSIALDLKPSSGDVNLIKSAIEKLHVPEDADDEDL